MSWLLFALGAVVSVGISDLFRKLGSNLHDPFLSNLIFQIGSVSMAFLLWMLFSRKFDWHSRGVLYALIGGLLISIFTTLSFKALELGPGVSTVMPVIRIGGVLIVATLGILLLKDKLTFNLALGLLLALSGIALMAAK
jgi:uncharacterized membrane protein